jgi:hypothetical protein
MTDADPTYDVGTLGRYFESIDHAWRLVLPLARFQSEHDIPVNSDPLTPRGKPR